MCITATQFNPMYFLVNYKWMVAVWNVRIQKTLLFTMSFEDMGQICYLPIKKKKSFMYVHCTCTVHTSKVIVDVKF